MDDPRQLTFFAAGQQLGCALARVREVRQVAPVTPLPLTPPWLLGLMNVRGAVVPVVDLGLKLGGGPARPDRYTCALLVERPAGDDCPVVALLVDRVGQVVEAGPGDLQPAPPFGLRLRLDLVRGLARSGEGFVPLLDLGRLLSAAELLGAAPGPDEGGA